MENPFLDKSFDLEFNSIKTLEWLPWVGKNYINKKIFIIGDSPFEDGDCWQKGNKDATRTIINEYVFEKNSAKLRKSKIHRSIERVIYNKKDVTLSESKNLWKSSVYFNLMQELMMKSSTPPTVKQIDLGWETFLDVAKSLKPTICIKCGLRGFGRLGYVLNNNRKEWKFMDIDFEKRPRVLNLTINDHKITLVFIKHPSGRGGFSYSDWATIVQNQFPLLQNHINA